MSTYDVSGHALLSDKAANLDSDELDAQTSVAEELLGLAGTTLSGSDKDSARRAIALQVSHQVRIPGEFHFAESEGRGGQSVSYRGTEEAIVDRRASAIAGKITSGSDELQPTTAARAEFRSEFPQG